MDSFPLAHSRKHSGVPPHLQLLFLEPSQWFRASGMMCNIFVDACIRHSGVSADSLHLPLPQASLREAFIALLRKLPSGGPGLSLCCAGIILPPTLPSSLAAARKYLALRPEQMSVGSGSVGSVELQTPGAFNVICFQKQGMSSLFKALN